MCVFEGTKLQCGHICDAKCMSGWEKQWCSAQTLFVFCCKCQGKTSLQIHLIMLNLTGTHVLPSPTDVLPNTAALNVSLYCQVLNVGPIFTHSGQTEINTWAKVCQAYSKVKMKLHNNNNKKKNDTVEQYYWLQQLWHINSLVYEQILSYSYNKSVQDTNWCLFSCSRSSNWISGNHGAWPIWNTSCSFHKSVVLKRSITPDLGIIWPAGQTGTANGPDMAFIQHCWFWVCSHWRYLVHFERTLDPFHG